jgi:hypothetical protein
LLVGNLRISMFHRAFFNSIIDKHQHMNKSACVGVYQLFNRNGVFKEYKWHYILFHFRKVVLCCDSNPLTPLEEWRFTKHKKSVPPSHRTQAMSCVKNLFTALKDETSVNCEYHTEHTDTLCVCVCVCGEIQNLFLLQGIIYYTINNGISNVKLIK